ncbi:MULTISPECIES: class I SAM-dependent methyltransferase [Streptomyces]|uniref:class I SAM-dependent methyltransferase n=1 Tax=Streptomyces TaxID=1883 RepID=UPI0004CCEB9D|nr:class I SAM-dependent methyltransferase [Streptomyces durhamensis]
MTHRTAPATESPATESPATDPESAGRATEAAGLAAEPTTPATEPAGLGVTLTTAYSDALAEVYDEIYPSTPDLEDIGDFLRTLTDPGASVLELGVGTGRVALPLAAKGFRVHGVDSSAGMLARLAEKDPEGRITPVQADFATLDLGRTFDVVLAPFNALCCAVSPDEQIALIHAVARHTAPGGHVVVETFDPSDFHVQRKNDITTYPIAGRGAMIESIGVLPASQNMMVHNTLFLDGEPPRSASTVMRYLWPSELDLLAGIARLELSARYAGWREQPFDGGDSRKMCVSVYRPLP